MTRIYTAMVADLFHPGHVAFLRAARQLGNHLTVYVLPDELIESHKGRRPIMTQAERMEVLLACRYVDAVRTDAPFDTSLDFMRANGFDIYAFACATQQERQFKYDACRTLPAAMIHELPYTIGISTSDIIGRMASAD